MTQPLTFTKHAFARLLQRFPELADELLLQECVSRARRVSPNTLNREAARCGRPHTFGPSAEYLRDDVTGLLLVCQRQEGKTIVLTVARNRKPNNPKRTRGTDDRD